MPEKDPMKEFREALDDLERCLFACEMEGWEDTAQTDAKAARARVEKLHEEALADAASSHEAGLTTSKCLAEEEADNDRLRADLASTRKALEELDASLRPPEVHGGRGMKFFLTEQDLNTIRGKVMAGHATTQEMMSVFVHYDALELRLDEADYEDMLGTEGWRRWVGLPE